MLSPVQSSNIKAVGYDAPSRALTVQFHNGTTHRYDDVPPEAHAAVMGQGQLGHSVGKAFHAKIKGGGFKSSKIE